MTNNETDENIARRMYGMKPKPSFVPEVYIIPPTMDEEFAKQEGLRRQQKDSNPYVNAYSVPAAQNNILEKSHAEDHLHKMGWKRYPRPNECFYSEGTCCYGCNQKSETAKRV